jgi:hypothetical protein
MNKNQQITKYFFLDYKKHSVIGADRMELLTSKENYVFFCAIIIFYFKNLYELYYVWQSIQCINVKG